MNKRRGTTRDSKEERPRNITAQESTWIFGIKFGNESILPYSIQNFYMPTYSVDKIKLVSRYSKVEKINR